MNRFMPICCLALTLLGMRHASSQETTGKASLLVLNQGDATLSFVDTATNRQVAVLDEGVARMVGHEVAASPDRRLAYVPLYGDSGVGKPGTDGNLMLVVDLTTRKIVRSSILATECGRTALFMNR